MLLHLLFFTLLLITSTISFTKHGYGKMYYPDGSAQFSPDNQYFVGGGNTLKYVEGFDLDLHLISDINDIKFHKNQDKIYFSGNSPNIYFTRFPNVNFNTSAYISTSNTQINQFNFNQNGSKIVSCGDTKISVHNISNGYLFYQFPGSAISCAYSDTEDRFGWTDGNVVYVRNSNFTNFYNVSLNSVGSITLIKFMKGYSYPIIFVNGVGIIKTAQANWEIIRTQSNIFLGEVSFVISKDGSQIIIAGDYRFRIYSISQFQPYISSTTPASFMSDYNQYAYIVRVKDISNNGKAMLLTFIGYPSIQLMKNCDNIVQWNCEQVCGDGIVIELGCDMDVSNLYDGCLDDCTVEKDFICTKDNVTKKSMCFYQKNLSLKLTYFERNFDLNVFRIILEFSPPLHCLKKLSTYTPIQLKSIFILPPKFNVLQCFYDQPTNRIEIFFSANQFMKDEQFYLNFDARDTVLDECFINKLQKLEMTTENNSQIMPICFAKQPPRFNEDCTEICGDAYAIIYSCDLQLGNIYDGCTDTCTVQENFSCKVDLTTNENFCIYEGVIQLELVNINKNMTVNQHTIVLSISPPLFSLKSLNQTEYQLSKIFILSPKFTSKSLHFDQNTCELSIVFSANEEMEDETFYIDFNPEDTNISQYLAFKSKRLLLMGNQNSQVMPFYFIGDSSLPVISLIISYSSVFISITGWILFFIGLVSKSLTGLETLMTFQFCSLTLHWLQCKFFMGLRYSNSLKYLSGYNVMFEFSNITTSQQAIEAYSLIRIFDIDLNFLVNNLNLTLLICVAFLIAFFVIRILILKQERKSDGFDESKMDQLKEHKNIIIDSLMYSMLPVYVPFLQYFTLFIEVGQITHAASWIFSICYLVLLILLLLKFYRNPSNFETFWFSFRLHRIHLHHFYFYILGFTLSTIFLIKLSNIPYVATIPIVFLFFYTLTVHPYSSLKESMRSALNYLVMSSFLAFNIFILNMRQQQVSSKKVYLFLGFNIVILLPIVFLLALASSVHHCYKRFYLLPKIIAKDIKDKEVDQEILNELNKANLIKKMDKINDKNDFFKNFVVGNESIVDYSNRLILQSNNNQNEQSSRNQNANMEHMKAREPTDQSKLQKIKNLKKKVMLDLQSQKVSPNGKRENFSDNKRYDILQNSTFGVFEEQKQDEEMVKKYLVKQTIQNENLFINAKRVIQKTENEISKREGKEEENDQYLRIYDAID